MIDIFTPLVMYESICLYASWKPLNSLWGTYPTIAHKRGLTGLREEAYNSNHQETNNCQFMDTMSC